MTEQDQADSSEVPDRRELTQRFLDGMEPIPMYELADYENLVGLSFAASDMNGSSCGEITLDKLDQLPPNETKRKSVRKYPFSLVFSRPDDFQMEEGCYKLTLKTDADQFRILFLKPLDFSAEDKLNIYESIIN